MYYPMRTVITGKYKLIWNIAWQLPYPSSTDLWASSTWQVALKGGSGMYAGRSIDDYMHEASLSCMTWRVIPMRPGTSLKTLPIRRNLRS